MGKKLNARERRELEKAQKKNLGNKINARNREKAEEEKRQEEERLKRIKEAERKKKEDNYIGKLNPDIRKSKSNAKAAGLKAALILDKNRILTTSFGKGNQSRREEYVIDGRAKSVDEEQIPVVSVKEAGSVSLKIKGFKNNEATINNPLYAGKENASNTEETASHQPGMDVIKCKPQLEKMYFGKTFEDNIHIQLIYNILDIEKILTVHVNNIVYMMNNLRRADKDAREDIIGCLSESPYEDFKKKKKSKEGEVTYDMFAQLANSPQIKYLGSFFMPRKEKGKSESREQFEERIYNALRVLDRVRQAVAHGNENARKFLYQLDNKEILKSKGVTNNKTLKYMLDRLYSEKVSELNESFWQNSGKDIAYLSGLYPEDTAIPKKYYDFVVKKSYKNKGFSVKHLREMLIEEKASWLSGDDRKSIRRKLNRYLDFSIHYAYEADEDHLTELVKDLRTCQSEEEKERRYYRELDWLLPQGHESAKINLEALEKLDGEYFKNSPANQENHRLIYAIDESCLMPEKATNFSEIIYLLTLFLDGKEINDLLTQLINKMDNISGFIDIMKAENIDISFKDSYKIFETRSRNVSEELRLINSFARMSSPDPAADKILYQEAATLLGFQGENLSDYLDREFMTKVKGEMGFRNFIINNVMKSSRFKYLVRYANPEGARKLANNTHVVSFVLKKIPDAQIDAFYKSCSERPLSCDFEAKRRDLCNKITTLDFKEFESTRSSEKSKGWYEGNKERKKNIVRLYLTVLYLLIKNLVYVNSRYFLAFHCAERDASLGGGNLGKNGEPVTFTLKPQYENFEVKNGLTPYARAFVEKNCKNRRVRDYLQRDFDNADEWALGRFRNYTAHLNVVRKADQYLSDIGSFDSYFELYHYLVQRCLCDQYENDLEKVSEEKKEEERAPHRKLEEYFEKVNHYGTYCKDFVKALCFPFAYNLARFKNLSMKELFDRNNYLPEEARAEWLNTASGINRTE